MTTTNSPSHFYCVTRSIRLCIHPPQLTNSPISKQSVFFTHTTSKPIILGTHRFNCCQMVLFGAPRGPHNYPTYKSDTNVTCVNGFRSLKAAALHEGAALSASFSLTHSLCFSFSFSFFLTGTFMTAPANKTNTPSAAQHGSSCSAHQYK